MKTIEENDMISIYTQCYSIEDADALGHFICRMGFEGVQNDSYRYCRLMIERAFEKNTRHNRNYCFIGVNGSRLVVGYTQRSMRNQYSFKFIEKERVFREKLLSYENNRRKSKRVC